MSNLSRLRPLVLPKNKVKRDPGPSPQPILLKLNQLRINHDYQRTLSQDSTQLGIKIAAGFDWEIFHLPVVSPLDEVDDITGLPLYEVLDGQHTSIGALTNGHVREVWCWPGRKGESLENRAISFNKLNTERTAVTPVQLFWSSVTAGKEEALEVVQACQNTGARVVKRPKPYGDMAVGETICVENLMELARKGGRPYVERVLRVAMNLRLAPISQMWIKAIEQLTLKKTSQHYIPGCMPSLIIPSSVDLAIENAVGRIGVDSLFQSAKMSNVSSVSAADRWPVHWWLAYFIKKEIVSHATNK